MTNTTPAILVLTGASGAGKTTLSRALEAAGIPGVSCIEADTIYENLPDEVKNDGALAQDTILKHWVEYVLTEPDTRLAVIATQIRPHKAVAMLNRLGIALHQVVLVESENAVRNARLRDERGQPELASLQMEHWAAYLRGQADAMGLPSVDTSQATIESSVAQLRLLVEALLEQRQAYGSNRAE